MKITVKAEGMTALMRRVHDGATYDPPTNAMLRAASDALARLGPAIPPGTRASVHSTPTGARIHIEGPAARRLERLVRHELERTTAAARDEIAADIRTAWR